MPINADVAFAAASASVPWSAAAARCAQVDSMQLKVPQ
ncbi:hypothetical protein XVE_1348 [Xanthomonas vesicatoria ATCC 35937]|uniref:Uncharacterized protein n=1 Tax=Xanthomonas vesicatoria ATCC 35937 TaxID=925775 RepID=F0BB79_9XANT|nr:hypothetical protein XVE_1348 [Xanthomonas vesicatoria ATCC 35937]